MGDTAPESRVGTQFGPYHLKRLLGRGGMGEVYEAEDTVKDRVVALKVLSKSYSQDPVFRKRLEREARTAGRLQEPHVVPIHDYGEIDGQLFIDMRQIDGIDLSAQLKRFGPLTPPRAVAIVRQIASALDAAHTAGVMHRDIKPENILVTRDDFAYLVDFGIAAATTDEHLTQMGTAIGTWKYMAPERFTNEEVTYRADIYALACVLHECLTGSPPYRADSTGGLITAHMMDPIPKPSQVRPGVPTAFDAVVARGMAKKPEDRYLSAGDLAAAAHDALSTPEQDHSTTILRRSQEATLSDPGAAAALFTPPPAHTPTPPPTAIPTPARAPFQQPVATFASGPPSNPIPAASGTAWPGQFGGPPQIPGGPQPWTPPPGKRNPWLPLAIAALVIAVALGGLGIWLTTRSSSNQSEPTTTTTTTRTTKRTTTTTTTTSSAVTFNQMLTQIPDGYPSGTCRQITVDQAGTVWEEALFILACDQNTLAGGASTAHYGLFADTTALNNAFQADIGTITLLDCPNEGSSPDTWHRNSAPDVVAGQLACGSYKDRPNVVWSNNDKLLLSDTFGNPPSLEDLYGWWKKLSI